MAFLSAQSKHMQLARAAQSLEGDPEMAVAGDCSKCGFPVDEADQVLQVAASLSIIEHVLPGFSW